MSDPTSDFSRMSHRLAEALNLPGFEHLSDSELEHLLDSAEPEAISEARQEQIVSEARQLIHEWELLAMMTPSHEAHIAAKHETIVSGSISSSSRRREQSRRGGSGTVVLAGLAVLAIAVLMMPSSQNKDIGPKVKAERLNPVEYLPADSLRPISNPPAAQVARVEVGSTIETGARERRRITLPDGSALFLNENTSVEVKTDRQLLLNSGEVFVEVVPQNLAETKTPFVVETPKRSITALGTKFAVTATKAETDVLVTQGQVKVTGVEEPITAGQILRQNERRPAPRVSEALLWTKELMASAESPLVPKSEHAGGALVAIDPNGQEVSLSLRKQHIDVHIEDGFARTTIDQTYFNSSWSQMEGTFYFPLPADASLSRLAMYVGENLMEGGMAERDHARNVFEQIRYTRRDPALLEWVDGSTFKMRVFPLEARQEKRIIISYTQRLQSAYGKVHYRFPAGHSLELIRDWSTHILVKNYAGYEWKSPSHPLESKTLGEDLVLEATARGIADERDLVIVLEDDQETHPQEDAARFSRMVHEGRQYLMLRFRPDLKGEMARTPRNWVFLFETGGNRDALLARVQIEVLETLLKNAEHSDTFSILTAATRPSAWKEKPIPATPENIKAALEHLNEVHLVGALDLGKTLAATRPFVEGAKNSAETYLVHLGAGIPVLGDKETEALLRRLPEGANYVGIGVGKRWSQAFMKEAARRTGGHVSQINPDEEVGWRSFELLSLLNSPRVLDVNVKADSSNVRFLQFSDTLAQGEELCAIARLEEKAELPKTLTITGKLQGKAYEKTIPVEKIAENAGYLPRTWAKLEIDRLVAAGAEQHKDEIITLSKAMYVMSPFTSLLVLETEEMYKQFNVDRGRKDHWAMYPCPPKIPIVYEPAGRPVRPMVSAKARAKTVEDLLKTVLVRIPPTLVRGANGIKFYAKGVDALQHYNGAYAAPVQTTRFWNYWSKRQSGAGGVPLTDSFRSDFGISPSGQFLGFSPDGGRIATVTDNSNSMRWDARFRNVWWEEFDGISADPFGSTSAVDETVTIWNGTSMMGGGVPLGWAQPQAFEAYSRFGNINTNGLWSRPYYPYQEKQISHFYSNMDFYDFDGELPQLRGAMNDFQRPALTTASPRLFGEMGDYGMPEGFQWLGVEDLIQTQGRFILELPESNPLPFGGYRTRGFYIEVPFGSSIANPEGLFGENVPVTRDWSLGRFGDLPAHAPGLNTSWVDVLSLLESQGPAERLPKRGTIDPKAQALIERARESGWERITLPAGEGQKKLTIRSDGRGRFVYERIVSEGLKERVVCDGESLLHLYEEIGLGARRTVSRFHRAEIGKLIPWLVPPAEDLAVGCDVKSVNDHTIALVPIAEDSETPAVYHLLVFRPDGNLQERQVVDAKTNKPLSIVKFGSEGLVEVFDENGKSLSKAQWVRESIEEAPNLEPDLKDIVVLPLPYRSPESLLSAEQQQLAHNSQFAALDEDSSLSLLGSYSAVGDMGRLLNLLNQRYFAKEDFRIGLYVLLASTYQHTGYGNPVPNLMQKHPSSALAEYLSQHFQWAQSGQNQEFVVTGTEKGFVHQLAMARNLYARWSTGQAVNDRSAAEIKIERERGLESLRTLRSPEFGWLLLTTMKSKDTDPQGLADYIQAADDFAKKPALALEARYQAAFWRSELGRTAEAVKQVESLSKELLDSGVLPPITEETRTVFINHSGLKAWADYLNELQAKFLTKDRRLPALVMAIRTARLKKDSLSEQLMKSALKGLSPEKHPSASLVAAGYLMEENRFAEAEALIAPLLKAEGWKDQPGLWRKASEIAGKLQQEPLSVARLERAIQLEYETLPDLVNLQKFRDDYSGLLSRMEVLAQQNAEADLKQRVIRLADRWRVIDPNDTTVCQLAARILTHLGEDDLAWDYLMTPVAERPNESAPWRALAEEMARRKDIDWADRAYREAFAAESTNAEILWFHAEFLRAQNRQEDAQEILEKLANGTWQPRFENLKTQAQQLLQSQYKNPPAEAKP